MTPPNPYEPPCNNHPGNPRSHGSAIPLVILIATPLICFVFGTAAGAVGRSFRNETSGVHYEAIIEMGVKVLVNVAVLGACFLMPKTWMRILNYGLATSLLWTTSTIAWTIVNGRLFHQHLAVNAISLVVALIAGMIILLVVALAKYAMRGGLARPEASKGAGSTN